MAGSSEIWAAFLKSGAMLAFVIALLVSLLYMVRRFSPMGRTSKGRKEIRVLEAHHLAPKEKLVLVNVLDQKILLGVTPQTITTLAVFDQGAVKIPLEDLEERNFSEVLKANVVSSGAKGEDHEA